MDFFKRIACLLNPQTKERPVEEVSVKIFHGEDIRRTAIPEVMEMKQLEQFLRTKFSIAEDLSIRISFSTLKSEPFVPLENQFDLDTAIQCAKTAIPPLLRLSLQTVQEGIEDWHVVDPSFAAKAEEKQEVKLEVPALQATINVEKTPEDSLISSRALEQKARNKFEDQLITLTEMGFTNRELNIRLLVANVGNLEDTIEALSSHVAK